MDSLLPIDLSASALSTNRLRMALIASNLANVHTTNSPEGGPYRRKDLMVTSAQTDYFQKALDREMRDGKAGLSTDTTLFAAHLRKVAPLRIITDQRDPLTVHAPWHPDADESGNVRMPNISVIEEMVNMIAATRGYEANVAVIKSTKEMVNQALEINRG